MDNGLVYWLCYRQYCLKEKSYVLDKDAYEKPTMATGATLIDYVSGHYVQNGDLQ